MRPFPFFALHFDIARAPVFRCIGRCARSPAAGRGAVRRAAAGAFVMLRTASCSDMVGRIIAHLMMISDAPGSG